MSVSGAFFAVIELLFYSLLPIFCVLNIVLILKILSFVLYKAEMADILCFLYSAGSLCSFFSQIYILYIKLLSSR